ncbi:MAG: hypothetical protein RLZZ419_404 [Pseudomonadota bacterium]|jgi:hypothetical protein
MASSQYSCSVRQGFNFEKDQQVLVGHLVSMTVGGTALVADENLTIPTAAFSTGSAVTTSTAVVGVISDISWEGGYADPIYMNVQVSNENQKTLSVKTHTSLLDTTVVFQFNIYAFDQVAKVYYLAFDSNATNMNGLIFKQGGDLSLSIDPDPSHEVKSPMNFALSIGIMPQNTAQVLNLAVSNTDKFVKTWGVTVAGT